MVVMLFGVVTAENSLEAKKFSSHFSEISENLNNM